MTRHDTTARGRAAEALVASHLETLGLIVLARNARVGRDELDLVVLDGATLVVVEVRARRAGAMVHPLETLTATKRQNLRRATSRYAAERGHRGDVRIDVVTVIDGAIERYEGAITFDES